MSYVRSPVTTMARFTDFDIVDMNNDGLLDLAGTGTLGFFDDGEFFSFTVIVKLQEAPDA